MLKVNFMVHLFFLYAIVGLCSFSSYAATTSCYQHELAADKAKNPSSWREYAKRYPIDPETQQKLHTLVADLAKHMNAGNIAVYVAEANNTNNFIPKKIDCTNTDNSYSTEFLGFFKSITIGEDLLADGQDVLIKKFIAHELAHIKANDFTKRFIVGLSYAIIAYYLIWKAPRDSNLFDIAWRTALMIPIGIALAACFEHQESQADSIAQQYLTQLKD